MDALEAILSRKVQRVFADKPVEREKLAKIVEAGRHAMSARNMQPWQFVVIQNRGTLKEIGALCTTGNANARWADVDCGQAVQNMANAGWALGLGTCWVGNFDAAKIGAMLGVKDGWAIFTILPFGYADSKNPPQSKPLKPRGEMVHYERVGNPKP
jgi:nitroreductase